MSQNGTAERPVYPSSPNVVARFQAKSWGCYVIKEFRFHRHGCCSIDLAMTLLWIIGVVWVGSAAFVSLALCAASQQLPPAIEEFERVNFQDQNPEAGFAFEKAA